MKRKLIVYIATSLDGYIAKGDDDLSFLSIVERPGEDYGYERFINTIDTVIVGRKTYDWVMKQVPVFPHANRKTYVVTRSPRPNQDNLLFYSGDLTDLIKQLKSETGKNIFVDGGAEVINNLIKNNLIDEYIISVVPVILGSGVRLFQHGLPEYRLELVNVQKFDSGLVQSHYKVHQ